MASTFDMLLKDAQVVQPTPYTPGPAIISKTELEGVPFIVTGYKVQSGRDDHEYVVVEIVLPDLEEPRVFTDGGAAIRPVLEQAVFPLYAPNGLELGRNGKTWRFAAAN